MKEYYESYWNRSDTYAEPDPLARDRLSALWNAVQSTGESLERLLDIGCGEGNLVADALHRGMFAEGLDISEEAIHRAIRLHPNGRFHAHSVEEWPWPVDQTPFDIVVSFEVIEHLLQPSGLIRGSHGVLRESGYLALTTPYHGPLKNVALSVFGFDKHFAVEGDHIRFFTDAALKKILESNGFKVISFEHFGRFAGVWAGVFVWAQRV